MTSAIVFAYHNIGVACLQEVCAAGIDVRLVVTHRDDPHERIWFASVAEWAAARGIEVVSPDDPNTPDFIARVAALRCDFLFSFYYRHMLKPALLAAVSRGAFNMHGSLLPKYRGRVPINWAIIKGETETGASFHEMVEKPDAGRLVDQEPVPIGPDETAQEVADKVTVAAARVVRRSLRGLIDGTAVLTVQDLSQGSYYGRRRPEDGVIDWREPARNVHNLVRAVAPPYPGASTSISGECMTVTKTRLTAAPLVQGEPGTFHLVDGQVVAICGDGVTLRLLEAEIGGVRHDAAMLAARIRPGSRAS